MDIKTLKIKDLRMADYNPRFIKDTQFEKLKNSLKEFGFVDPVIVNQFPGRENIIVGGHMRVRAAEALGMEEVPCVMVSIDPIKEKIFNIALNRIHGDWDEEKLAEAMVSIAKDGGDVRLSGFEDQEVVSILEDGVITAPSDMDSDSHGESETGKREVKCPKCGNEFNPRQKSAT